MLNLMPANRHKKSETEIYKSLKYSSHFILDDVGGGIILDLKGASTKGWAFASKDVSCLWSTLENHSQLTVCRCILKCDLKLCYTKTKPYVRWTDSGNEFRGQTVWKPASVMLLGCKSSHSMGDLHMCEVTIHVEKELGTSKIIQYAVINSTFFPRMSVEMSAGKHQASSCTGYNRGFWMRSISVWRACLQSRAVSNRRPDIDDADTSYTFAINDNVQTNIMHNKLGVMCCPWASFN